MEGVCKYRALSARCMGSYWTAPAKPVGPAAAATPTADGGDASAEQYTDLGPDEVRVACVVDLPLWVILNVEVWLSQ